MAQADQEHAELVVMGATVQGFAQACLNLNIVAGSKASGLVQDIEVMQFYPFDRLRNIEQLVLSTYESAGPIMERVGMHMMMGWYHFGPGQQFISKGVDFLRFQSGSMGYASVVKGPEEQVGAFMLKELNEVEGRAVIHSTSPFDKRLERGVIIGGMSAPGDLDYIDVDNSEDPHVFHIEFH